MTNFLSLSFLMMMMFVFGLFSVASKRKHLLPILLSMEMMILAIFSNLVFLLNIMSLDFMFIMVFLTFAVCEGSLGLSILVSMVRSYGNDFIQNLNLI